MGVVRCVISGDDFARWRVERVNITGPRILGIIFLGFPRRLLVVAKEGLTIPGQSNGPIIFGDLDGGLSLN